jgi:hypothetical protein
VSDKPAHRVYRGVADDHDGTNPRILVMDGGPGPTERERANLLYELAPEDPFWWGYGGGSPGRTATAIIEDVLPEAIPGQTLAELPSKLREQLTLTFMQDFLAYSHDGKQFWLPARTIVRWMHGLLREMRQS